MRFPILTFVTLSILFSIGFVTVASKEHGATLDNMYSNLTKVQTALFNLTSNTLTYSNPYTENFTVTDFVYNTIHGAMYTAIVDINTLLGISINWFYYHANLVQMVFILKLIVFLVVAWILIRSFVPVGAIYIFYEEWLEKKKLNVNKWLILTLATITWFLGLILLFILVEVIL